MRKPKKIVYYIALFILTLSIISFFMIRKIVVQQPLIPVIAVDTVEYIPIMKYGINIDSFDVIHATIKKNQLFSTILSPFNISASMILAIADSAENILPLRKIRAGNDYVILLTKDSLPTAQYFIYEQNTIEFIVFKLFDPVRVYKGFKNVDTLISHTAGIISTSLWADMAKSGASPLLISEMSDIYEWDIDFFRITKGDKYKIIYEETLVEGTSVGIGKIISAWFEHNSDSFYAFYFVQGDQDDYFDAEGKNLRKMLLKAPLKFSRISSGFSNSRFHPVLHRYRAHHGVDYAAPYGTPVHAVGNGVVIQAGYSGGAGNMVKIRHNSTYTTAYLHLSKFGKGIKNGVNVKQSDVIGYVGSTGLSTGAHLDYRIWKNGTPINPLTLKLPPVESVADTNLSRYNLLKDSLMIELDKIKIPNYKAE